MQGFRNLIVIAIAMVAMAPVFGQQSSSDERSEKAFRNAEDLYRKGKYAAAQHAFDVLVASPLEDPKKAADAVYYAAVCSQKLENGDAMYRLEEFLRLYPESSHANMAYFYEGNTLYNAGNYGDALKKYNKVNSAEVEYGHRDEFEYKLGYCHLIENSMGRAGSKDKAKSCFSHIMNGQSTYQGRALYYYAYIQYKDGDYAQALKNFQRLEASKNSDQKLRKIAQCYIVRIYYYLGKEDEFLQMAPILMEEKEDPLKSELQEMMGEVYFNRGEYAQALKHYRKAEATLATEQKNDNSNKQLASGKSQKRLSYDNAYQLGYSYYMLHNYDSAATYLEKKVTSDDSIGQNAIYTLADTYLELGRKQDARTMFRHASEMSHNATIQEDALFNYAKLSSELNQNAYNESIKSFESYLKKYPRTTHQAEIRQILTSLYFSTRNYKDALALIEKIEPKNAEMNQAYQRLLINRGIELFNERNIKQANKLFQEAVRVNADVQRSADALYLLAETQYRLDNAKGAKKSLDRFFLNSKAKNSPHYGQALYTYGYVNMAVDNYSDATENFQQFIRRENGKVDGQQIADAYNRLGDCQYVRKQFSTAIESYNYVINNNGKDADYATYQKALCYGAIGKSEDKLIYLNRIFEHYKESPLASKAMFEMANTYLVCDNNEMALLYFNKFENEYPQSAYVKEALLNKGLIYYNTNRNEQALVNFERLISQYPGTDEARDALVTVKNIYIAENRVDDYFTYVRTKTKIVISSNEQDSITFNAAANRYYEGDYSNAVPSLENYLRQFPNGLYSLNAHYYLADCLFRMGQNEQALPHFESVAKRNKNQYTETSLLNAANIAFNLSDNHKALDYYVSLLALAESDNSRLQARTGILRCWNRLENHDNIISAANELLNESKLTDELRDEATVSIARSYYNAKNFDQANAYYANLLESPNGEYSGEAIYRRTEALHLQGNDAAAERAIEGIISNPPSSDYWLAKTFILWADIFYAQGNNLQAKQTLQSIIDNYESDHSAAADALINEALQKRNAILMAEAEASDPSNGQTNEIEIEVPLGDEE